jgi:hypothetical protein
VAVPVGQSPGVRGTQWVSVKTDQSLIGILVAPTNIVPTARKIQEVAADPAFFAPSG